VTFFSANLGACSTLASCSEAQQRVSAIELAPTEWREKSPAVGLHRSWTPLQSDLEQGAAVQAREEKLLELQLQALVEAFGWEIGNGAVGRGETCQGFYFQVCVHSTCGGGQKIVAHKAKPVLACNLELPQGRAGSQKGRHCSPRVPTQS